MVFLLEGYPTKHHQGHGMKTCSECMILAVSANIDKCLGTSLAVVKLQTVVTQWNNLPKFSCI